MSVVYLEKVEMLVEKTFQVQARIDGLQLPESSDDNGAVIRPIAHVSVNYVAKQVKWLHMKTKFIVLIEHLSWMDVLFVMAPRTSLERLPSTDDSLAMGQVHRE